MMKDVVATMNAQEGAAKFSMLILVRGVVKIQRNNVIMAETISDVMSRNEYSSNG